MSLCSLTHSSGGIQRPARNLNHTTLAHAPIATARENSTKRTDTAILLFVASVTVGDCMNGDAQPEIQSRIQRETTLSPPKEVSAHSQPGSCRGPYR